MSLDGSDAVKPQWLWTACRKCLSFLLEKVEKLLKRSCNPSKAGPTQLLGPKLACFAQGAKMQFAEGAP
jgi:hypothetical protein